MLNKIPEPRLSHFELHEEIFLYHDTDSCFSGWYSAFVPACSLPPTRSTTKISTPILSPSRSAYAAREVCLLEYGEGNRGGHYVAVPTPYTS
jgi:hypothetical protein